MLGKMIPTLFFCFSGILFQALSNNSPLELVIVAINEYEGLKLAGLSDCLICCVGTTFWNIPAFVGVDGFGGKIRSISLNSGTYVGFSMTTKLPFVLLAGEQFELFFPLQFLF
jgi:hypothetical protein